MATIDQLTLAAVLDAEMLIPVNLFGQTLKIKLGQLLAAQNSLTIVQYSADGADGSWHADLSSDDKFVRISLDGGNSWGPAINLHDPDAQPQKGEDGKTYYTWMKFADTATPQTAADIYDEPRDTTTAIGWAYNKSTPNESDDPSDYTWTRFKGADAVELDAVQEYYAVGASSTLPPTDGWVEVPKFAMPAMTAAKPYLWNYERSTYNNGAYRDTQARCVGRRGDDGTSITKVTDYYLASAKETGVTTADDGWTTLIASAEASWGVELPYLWNYEKREWSNGFVDYVQPHRIARWASDGTNGQGSVNSYVFCLSERQPATPTGGSYTNLVPVGWSDGFPADPEDDNFGLSVWMSRRLFTSDGLPPQDPEWTEPALFGNNSHQQVMFSTSDEQPPSPAVDESAWDDEASRETVWMATRYRVNSLKNPGWSDWSIIRIKGEKGEDGKDGVGITSQTVTYSTLNTEEQPADSTFTLSRVPTLMKGQWLWSKTEIKYSNGEISKTYGASRVGTDGTSVGIKSTSVTYAKTTSVTQPTDADFIHTSIEDTKIAAGEYLWTKSTTVYTDGKSMTSYSVSRIGSDGNVGTPGKAGADGRTPYLHIAYANSADGSSNFATSYFEDALYMGTYTDYNAADPTDYKLYKWSRLRGKDGVTVSSTSVRYSTANTASRPADSTFTLSDPPALSSGQYLWSRTTVTYSDGKSTNAYAVSRIGENGLPGTSVSVASSATTYAKSSSLTQPTDSSFTAASIGALNAKNGDYIWSKTTVTYTDGKSTTSYSVSRIGSDGPQGVPGVGTDGKTYYFHQAYANNSTGTSGFSVTYFDGAAYMGTCSTLQAADPTDPSAYVWARIKGSTPLINADGSITYATNPSLTDLEVASKNMMDSFSRIDEAKNTANAASDLAKAANGTADSANQTAKSALETAKGTLADVKNLELSDFAKFGTQVATKNEIPTSVSDLDDADDYLQTNKLTSKLQSLGVMAYTPGESCFHFAGMEGTCAGNLGGSSVEDSHILNLVKDNILDVHTQHLIPGLGIAVGDPKTYFISGVTTDRAGHVTDLTYKGIDLTQYALKGDLNNYVTKGDLADCNYATLADIPSLTGYATQSWVDSQNFFKHRGAIPTAFIDLTSTAVGATGYANYASGTYQIQRSGYSQLFVNLAANTGSCSALQFYTGYNDTDNLYFRKTIDSNRISGAWVPIITPKNIGNYAITSHQSLAGYAKLQSANDFVHAGNEWTVIPDGYANSTLWLNWRAGANGTASGFTQLNIGNGTKGGFAAVVAGGFVRSGGTASQFLKADGTVDGNSYALTSHTHSYLTDRTTGTATYLNYGAAGITTTSWFAVWNNYELRAMTPANVLSTINALSRNGGSMATTTVVTNLNADLLDGVHNGNLKAMYLNYSSATITSTANDTTSNWGSKPFINWYATAGQLISQPSQYGYLMNIGFGSEVHQMWFTQSSGNLYHRGGNSSGWNGGGAWRTIVDSGNVTNNNPMLRPGYSNVIATIGGVSIGCQIDNYIKADDVENLIFGGPSASNKGLLSEYGYVTDGYVDTAFKTASSMASLLNAYTLSPDSLPTYAMTPGSVRVVRLLHAQNGSPYNGYDTRVDIGLQSYAAWSRPTAFLRVGSNDSGTTWATFTFGSNGNFKASTLTCTGLDFGSHSAMTETALDLNGTITCVKLTQTSDIRLKNITRHLSLDVRDIAAMPMIEFDYKNQPIHAVGTIAQAWLNVLPSAIGMRKDGYYTFQYAEAALISAISIARKVVSHDDRITTLEREVAQLTTDKQRLEADNLRLNNLLQEIIKAQSIAI